VDATRSRRRGGGGKRSARGKERRECTTSARLKRAGKKAEKTGPSTRESSHPNGNLLRTKRQFPHPGGKKLRLRWGGGKESTPSLGNPSMKRRECFPPRARGGKKLITSRALNPRGKKEGKNNPFLRQQGTGDELGRGKKDLLEFW